MLLAAGANANLWQGAALQAVEIRNRKIMREMGSPQLQLPVFGQKVVVKKRRWKREAWEAITQNETYVGPCPDMTFGLRVMDAPKGAASHGVAGRARAEGPEGGHPGGG